MLGNIQFIGQLYKHSMLTERIMHACIQQLLENVDNPKREDMECLCKLMTTIGRLLDGSAKSRPLMDVYFQRVQGLAGSDLLESRLKFLLLVRLCVVGKGGRGHGQGGAGRGVWRAGLLARAQPSTPRHPSTPPPVLRTLWSCGATTGWSGARWRAPRRLTRSTRTRATRRCAARWTTAAAAAAWTAAAGRSPA